MARMLKEAGIGGDIHVMRKLRETSEFLKIYCASFAQQSEHHKEALCLD